MLKKEEFFKKLPEFMLREMGWKVLPPDYRDKLWEIMKDGEWVSFEEFSKWFKIGLSRSKTQRGRLN